MKSEAIYLIKYGDSFKAFEKRAFDLEDIHENEVLIEVEAFGLNYAEVMARNKMYREAPPLPCILGYEVVGKVISLGSQIPEEYLNQRVLVFTRFGGYSKHVKGTLQTIVKIGDLESDKALALATQYVTAFYMCEYLSPIHKNDTVLVHAAAGGVGSALIQLAKRKGAKVYAKVSSEKKEEYVKSIGADFAINYKTSDYGSQLRHLTKNEGLDVIFNPVAGSTFKKDMRLLKPGGKIFLYGGSEILSGKFGFFSSLSFVWKMGLILPIGLMMKSKNILGVNMLKIADTKAEVLQHCLNEVVNLCLSDELKVESGTLFPSNEIAEAHHLLESGNSIGKIGIFWA